MLKWFPIVAFAKENRTKKQSIKVELSLVKLIDSDIENCVHGNTKTLLKMSNLLTTKNSEDQFEPET